MTYTETADGRFQFFKDGGLIAKVENDELIIYGELSDEEIREIKNTASI